MHRRRKPRRERIEIRLAGEGGQGLILAGLILAEAAAVYDGKYACQTQSYGPEARGGASNSEVSSARPGDRLSQSYRRRRSAGDEPGGLDKYHHESQPDGTLIVDSVNVQRVPTSRAISVPITRIAEEATGRSITANVVGLGLLVGLTGSRLA